MVAAASVEVAWLSYALSPTTNCSAVGYNETCYQSGTVLGSVTAEGAAFLWALQGIVAALALLALSAFLLASEASRPAGK